MPFLGETINAIGRRRHTFIFPMFPSSHLLMLMLCFYMLPRWKLRAISVSRHFFVVANCS